MDAPGIIVTRVDGNGLARVALLGNRAAAELVGATVTLDGGIHAILGYERPRSGKDTGEVESDQLFLESGLGAGEARRRIPVGTVGALEDRPSRIGDLWCAANVDNRAGCAALIAALRAARAPRYDLHAVFTAQSELGARGATTTAFGVDPDVAVVVDVAHLDSKGPDGVALGKGPCLGLKEDGYVAHPGALGLAKRAAAGAKVKTQWLIREAEGSDARAVRGARVGVPTVLVAIPARRSGGAASLVHARDLSQMAKLLAQLLQTPAARPKGGRR
jgi:endoglucanase